MEEIKTVKFSNIQSHGAIKIDIVKIMNNNFANYFKRKVSEAIYIKQKKLS